MDTKDQLYSVQHMLVSRISGGPGTYPLQIRGSVLCIEHVLRARHSSEHFLCINTFTSHNVSAKYGLLSSHLQKRKIKHPGIKGFVLDPKLVGRGEGGIQQTV